MQRVVREAQYLDRRTESFQVAPNRKDRAKSESHGEYRGRRQVREPGRFLQEPARGNRARRNRKRGQSKDRLRRRRGARKGRSPEERLASAHAIIIPGGFGERGIDGKIRAVRFARENRVPILGICLRLAGDGDRGCAQSCSACKPRQLARDFDENTPDPVIHMMESAKRASRTRAAPCAWARIHARSGRDRLPMALYRRVIASPNAIGIATK